MMTVSVLHHLEDKLVFQMSMLSGVFRAPSQSSCLLEPDVLLWGFRQVVLASIPRTRAPVIGN
jgi:hypothetical protein